MAIRTRISFRTAAGLAFVAVAAACVAGCPANLEDPERFLSLDGATTSSSGCGDVTQTIFLPTCSMTNCHNAASKEQGLDLQSPDPASRLVNVPSTEGPGLLIDPSMPSNSVLYTKLSATPPFGARMPFGMTPLDDATLACVLQWINEQIPAPEAGTGDDTGAGSSGSSGGSGSGSGDDTGSPPPPGDDSGNPPSGDDGSTMEMEASTPPPPKDAGKPDTGTTPPKDAGSTPMDSGSTGPVDAGGGAPADAGTD
jgi:hypothetical protein